MKGIKLVKLITGETVLAKIKEAVDGWYELSKPVVLRLVGPGELGMSPWLGPMNMNEPVKVKVDHVVAVVSIDEEITRSYNEQFHGGISIATPAEASRILTS